MALRDETPSAEFRRLQAAKSNENLSSPGTSASEKTLLSPQVCAPLGRGRSGLHLISKMLAFLRSVSRLLDTRTSLRAKRGGMYFMEKGLQSVQGADIINLFEIDALGGRLP